MEIQLTVKTMEWIEGVLAGTSGLLVSEHLGAARDREWRGAVIDSRAECSGRIFFAIRGERTDGHRYVEDAHAAGCVAAVVESGPGDALAKTSVPHLVVSDSIAALQECARAYRGVLDARVVAVTGSAGKTTTKEYIRSILRTKYRVHSNAGNYNSLIGVPVTVLEADEDCEYLVSEVGANQTGEVGFLAELIRPDVGVVTNIGDAHVGYFGSRGAIAAAKGELLDHIDPSGVALLPRDDDYFDTLRDRARCKVLSFGAADADFVLSQPEEREDSLLFEVNGEELTLHALGRYNAMNACAAFAAGEVCGIDPASARNALAALAPMPGRGRIHEAGGVLVVDESYNASPASTILSLSMIASRTGARRRIAVLGDMKELGESSRDAHERVGRHAATLALDIVWWVGAEAPHFERGLRSAGGTAAFEAFSDVAAAIAAAAGRIGAGDAVLVKASRACALDRFVKDVLAHIEAGEGN